MGIITKGILGGFSKKVGTVVGANYHGLDTLRSVPKKSSKPKTEAQLEQQAKFKTALNFVAGFKDEVAKYYKPGRGTSAYANALAYHLKNAVTGGNGIYTIDPDKVKLGQGTLPGIEDAVLTAVGKTLTLSFKSAEDPKRMTDKVKLYVYDANNIRHYKYDVGTRGNGTGGAELPEGADAAAMQAYVVAETADGKQVSGTMPVKLTVN